jgi:hypothetical protein
MTKLERAHKVAQAIKTQREREERDRDAMHAEELKLETGSRALWFRLSAEVQEQMKLTNQAYRGEAVVWLTDNPYKIHLRLKWVQKSAIALVNPANKILTLSLDKADRHLEARMSGAETYFVEAGAAVPVEDIAFQTLMSLGEPRFAPST